MKDKMQKHVGDHIETMYEAVENNMHSILKDMCERAGKLMREEVRVVTQRIEHDYWIVLIGHDSTAERALRDEMSATVLKAQQTLNHLLFGDS